MSTPPFLQPELQPKVPRAWDVGRPSWPNYAGILLGVLFGVAIRITSGLQSTVHANLSAIMTLSFVVGGPVVLGFLTVYPVERRIRMRPIRWCMQPWVPLLLTCAATAVFKLEGTICIVMLLPIGLILASIGGIIGGQTARIATVRKGTLTCIALLPFLLAPAETYLHAPVQLRSVENTITIHASPDAVWRQIQSVPPISASELKPNWAHAMGFPRPVAAVLSHPGLGGVRTATFEHGLVFYETVTDWQPGHQLGFSIKADTAAIPPTTLDEHVSIGGPYFDVLDGQYRIEAVGKDTVVLHLLSHQRLSTNFNVYAGLWSSAVMSNLQTSILQVVQHRSEAQPNTYTSSNR